MSILKKALRKLRYDERGNIGVIGVGLVAGFITIAIVLIVGLITAGQLFSVADTYDLGATGNATRTSLQTQFYNAMNLTVILLIVAAAGAIILVITMYFGMRGK